MESTYLYYPRTKIFSILISELPKRGYGIVDADARDYSISVRKRRRFLFRGIPLTIQMEDSGTIITKIHCSEQKVSDGDSKHTPDLIKEILRIF